MTTERPQTGSAESSGEDIRDPAVSRLYRQIATEQSPAHLDAAILRKAAQPGTSRYARSVHWLRPLAWAATVGLCLAIVVELSIDPSLMPELRDAEDSAPAAAESKRGDVAADDLSPADTPSFEREPAASSTMDETTRNNAKTEPAAAVADNNSFIPRQTSIVEDAESQARLREGSVAADLPAPAADLPAAAISLDRRQAGLAADSPARSAAPAAQPEEGFVAANLAAEELSVDERSDGDATEPVARREQPLEAAADTRGFAALAVPESGISTEVVPEPCNEAWPDAPERWLECIEALEDAGRDDEALRQRDLLAEAFPQYPQR